MLKKGFTLQELLITMGIVGIISALVIPGVVNMMPDKNKTMYMKVYNTLTTLTNEILEDSSLYYPTYNATTGEPNCTGMRCTAMPIDSRITSAFSSSDWDEGDKKFGVCLASKLNIKENFGSEIIFGTTGNDGTRFTTMDGIQWTYEPNNLDSAVLTINLDPSDNSASHNCLYSAACTKPNQFKFEIDNDGGVRAADALGIAYLQTPTDTHNSSKDREFAESIYADTVDAMYTKLNKKLNPSTTTKTNTGS